MPLAMRSFARATSSNDPGHRLIDRARGNETRAATALLSSAARACDLHVGQSRTRVKPAGGGSVCHSASIAAIFIFWFSLAT